MNAISRLGIVPVRANSSDSSEMVSQLLYGERCSVLKKEDNWSYISTEFDGYNGWVDTLQISELKSDIQPDNVVCAPFIELHEQILPMGSEVMLSEIKDKTLLSGKIKLLATQWNGDAIAEQAHHFLKSPYLWGGKTIFGVDCSGLTQILYKIAGYPIPRDSGDQEKMGDSVALKNSLNGDLAFFSKPGKENISHVGVILRDEDSLRIIHASSWVKKDQLTAEGIIDPNGIMTHRLLSVKRVI